WASSSRASLRSSRFRSPFVTSPRTILRRRTTDMDFSKIAKNLGRTLSDNSPVILTGMAVAGTVSAAILAAKGGMQAQQELDALLEEVEEGRANEELLTFQGKVKTTWKFYIPAGLMTGATVACVIGAHSVNTRRNAAIMSAYSLTDKR